MLLSRISNPLGRISASEEIPSRRRMETLSRIRNSKKN